MASEANIYLRNLKEGLFAKKLQACTEAFQQLAGLVDKPQQFGAEIGKVLKQLYDSYEADIFYSFTAWIEKHPAQDLADAAMEPVRDAFNMVRDWRKTLKDIHTESLSRLIRSQIRSRDVQAAAETTIRFIDEHTGSKTHVARQVGAILGSLNVDRARSEKLMEFLESKKKATGFRPEDYKAMRDSYAASQNNLSLSEVSQMELQWDRMHTDAVVQLMRLLPGRAASRQPSAEDVQKVHDAFHAVIAAYFSDPEHLGFAEVARLLSEFCPADPREIGPVEGIEDVAFLRMGSNDKLASVRSLRQLGKSDKLVAKVLEMAKRPMDGKAVERMVRLMGGLSSPKFAPFLIKVIENKKMDRLRNEAVDALGRVGGDQALSVLQDLLDEYCGTRIIDPPTQRKISGVIAALGRIARHPDTSDQQRNAIVLKSFRSLPESSGLQRLALQHFCTYNPAGLSPQAQQIAVHYIVNNLWSQETKSKLAKGNPNQRTELGFREMLVDILKNMGSSCLGILIPEAEKRVMQYSGAYWAMAEAFSDIGDVRALPMLERMLINTLRADDDDIPEHMRETFYDAAQDAYVPITRDKIAHAICYTIRKTCGKKGVDLLKKFARQIQKQEIDAPGDETASFLGSILSGDHIPGLPPVEEMEEAPVASESSGTEHFDPDWAQDKGGSTAPQGQARPREGDSIKSLLKDIRGKGLFKTKVEKRVSAIQEAGARRDPEAIAALVELLDDPEVILRSAAQTALKELINPFDKHTIFHYSMAQFLEALKKAPDSRLKPATEFLLELHPDRQPTQKVLLGLVENEKNPKVRSVVADAFRETNKKKKDKESASMHVLDVDLPDSGLSAGVDEEEEGDSGPAYDPNNLTKQDMLALKRRYFKERQEWIRNGKQGPEPKPPAGVSF